jgi:hypothetical protein
VPYYRDRLIERLRADVPLLPKNLRYFARLIRQQKDSYNKYWRELIVKSLEHYADTIDPIITTVKQEVRQEVKIKEIQIPIGVPHGRKRCVVNPGVYRKL